MLDFDNPFALVKASDISDEEINSLWVDLGEPFIESLIEPRARVAKFILGGKGTGKTHLLRYYSYPALKLRAHLQSGIKLLEQKNFLAVFMRATSVDASRFNSDGIISTVQWQQVFGIYFELKLMETLLSYLADIKSSSKDDSFNDEAFVSHLSNYISDSSFQSVNSSLDSIITWVTNQRKIIDKKVNNAAFTGNLDLHIPFSIGSLCLNISSALSKWNKVFENTVIVYLIDEIENFNLIQQEVINTLIRHCENKASFRVTGRLYALKTTGTIGNGEDNRPGAEFKTVYLDDLLRADNIFPKFANSFIEKRLSVSGKLQKQKDFKAKDYFEEIDSSNFYENHISELKFKSDLDYTERFSEALNDLLASTSNYLVSAPQILETLTNNLPTIIKKLNILRFVKRYKKNLTEQDLVVLAKNIYSESYDFILGKNTKSYKNAYEHYSADLFAQLCRRSNRELKVPYAGFDSFVRMSCGNPRNLLIILGMAYSISSFKNIDFISNPKLSKLSIQIQTQAALESANFIFDIDTNSGKETESARIVTRRIATVLRTARYSLNIPEVSPLTFSFEDDDLTNDSRESLKLALNYSFLFEIKDGRPDRNSHKLHRKIQLNPLLSPRWGLPIVKGGDLKMNRELLNSIFELQQFDEFEVCLKKLTIKWRNPFKTKKSVIESHQDKLF